MKCAECGEDFPEGELVYNDDVGSDVCEECDNRVEEEVDTRVNDSDGSFAEDENES